MICYSFGRDREKIFSSLKLKNVERKENVTVKHVKL